MKVLSQGSIIVVGYNFVAGDNLFGNPLTPSSLSRSFNLGVPLGTIVSLWNPASASFDQFSTFTNNVWSVDLLLSPGQGAKLTAPYDFPNAYFGAITQPNRDVLFQTNNPTGVYLLSCPSSMQLSPTNVFGYLIGRSPSEGEQVITLDTLTQTYHTNTYALGSWENGDPLLRVGEAAYFNIGPVAIPEPTFEGLLALALCCTHAIFRRR